MQKKNQNRNTDDYPYKVNNQQYERTIRPRRFHVVSICFAALLATASVASIALTFPQTAHADVMTRQHYYDYEFGETARYIDDAPQQVVQFANRLYDAVYSLDNYISIDGVSEDNALLTIDLMRQNHPEMFYLEPANTETSDGNLTGIVLKYRYDVDRVPSMRADYERSVSEALSWTSDEYSEIENAKALHDYIVLHTAYGYHGDIAFGDESHTVYTYLVDNLAVCDGYAKAYATGDRTWLYLIETETTG